MHESLAEKVREKTHMRAARSPMRPRTAGRVPERSRLATSLTLVAMSLG